ncbi:histone-lysine N-methyltransferase 2D isoform X2 [Mixophyes fleayi]|uniref:histone-lysine N-methyltransferase 2D isoform X2 n=1 Tax=Mixophyes fleayi TaxID=3061075 RepID=UPI003F4D71EE
MDDQKPSSEDKESEASADENASDVACEAEADEPSHPSPTACSVVDGSPPDPPCSSGFHTRRCALCNCDGCSPQGQRELQRFDPSPGHPELDPARCQVQEIGTQYLDPAIVGFAESVLPEELFEPSGHCWVHYWCASWSYGVHNVEGTGLVNVDIAVFSGISQKCEYCNRMGATIQCHSTGCLRRYHFPCAAASGSFQSMKTLKLLCTEHVAEAVAMDDSRCVLCDKPGDLTDLLFCTSCGLHYHGSCLEISVTPLKRSGWQCPECKVCQTCRKPGEDSMMLVCDACDKGYHTFCLKPAIEDLPTGSWKCKHCRVCRICGSRTAHLEPGSPWYENYSVCKKCQEKKSRVEMCVQCNQPDSWENMHQCSICSKFHHSHCAKVSDSLLPSTGCLSCSKLQSVEKKSDERDKSNAIPNTALSECEAKPLDILTADEDEPCVSDNEAAEAPEMLPNTPLLPIEIGIQPPLKLEPSPQERIIDSCPSLEEAPVLVTVEDEDMEVEEEGTEDLQEEDHHASLSPQSPLLQTSPLITSIPDRTRADNSVNEDTQPMDSVSIDGGTCQSPTRTKENPSNSFYQHQSILDSEMNVDSEEFPCKSTEEILNTDMTLGQDIAGDFSNDRVQIPIRCTIIKSDIVNEISNLSQGDTTSSFHGSDALGSPDPEGGSLSMEMCLHKEDGSLRLCTDSMPETDDSLLYDPSVGKLDGEKSRRKNSPGRSRVKHGRSSSFPGRRRPRGAGNSRGRGRSRLKSTTSSIETLPMADVESSPGKDEEEEEDDTMQNTVVLFSNTDKFVLMQDMCVVCGSFGRGSEGHLLACSQCSQCYHPYCVNSKITKVMLLKGWRCVECIVCEVCGKATDPSRLLLCDDCDISYHTYCLDPPLHTVPKGGWKCKWCVCCMQCGALSPGFHAEWQNNYTHCASCASLVSCPVCHLNYLEGDLLIQCQNCERWLHAVCENLFTEEEVEQAADEGFDCASCQPFIIKPVVPVIPPMSPVKIKEPEPQYFRFEGVWLTEAGMAVLRSLTLSPIQKKKPRRSRLSTSGEIFLDGPEHGAEERKEGDAECEELKADGGNNDPMVCEIKTEPPGSPDRDAGGEMEIGKGIEDAEDAKKKKRKPYRPGIGGFMIRQRKTHTRSKKGHAAFLEAFRESQSQDIHPEDAPQETPTVGGTEPGTAEGDEKKKRRGRKKSKLEDMFPAYLQATFFGKELMELSKQALLAARPAPQKIKSVQSAQCQVPGGTPQISQLSQQSSAETVAASTNSALPHEDSDSNETKTENPEMPKMESTDIQELLKDVLGTNEREQPVGSSTGRVEGPTATGSVTQSQRPFVQGVSLASNLQLEPFSQSGFLDTRDRSGLFSPEQCDTDGSWTTASTPTTPTTEGENDGLSYNQRSLQRWEKDEELGELSTISPVLYANKNFPNLKKDYPDWSSRCKQIMKLWRKVPAPDKAPYLQKAKDNRAAHRINKVQKQAENQINKQSKVEGVRKAERPVLQLQIPNQSGSQPGVNPDYRAGASAGQDLFMSGGSAMSTSSDLFLKPSSAGTPGAESSNDLFFKLPPQSPSQEHFPSSPAYSLDPRYQSSLAQSPASSAGFQTPLSGGEHQHALNAQNSAQSMDYQPCHTATPHQPEPFVKPRYSTGSLDNLSMVGSPNSRLSQSSENSSKLEPMMSPTRYGDPKRQTDGVILQIKKEDFGLGSPCFSHSVGSDGTAEMKCDVFKAPLTPRMSQLEPHSPAPSHRDAHMQPQVTSPQHHSDMYRQSSTALYTDPFSQPPLTPRPQPVEGTIASRALSSDPFTRVPTSPQSQGSSQSPLTPRPLSTEAFCPSPVTPRFQSPDPYSRPPSRPQSRDPFAPHKPPRPQMIETGFKPSAQISHSTHAIASYQPSLDVHPKVQVSQQQALFARSPGTSVYQSSQNQLCFTFPHSPGDGVKSSPSHQSHASSSHPMNSHFTPSKPQSYSSPSSSTASSFHPVGSPHSSGNSSTSDMYVHSPLRPASVLPQEAPYQSPATGQRTGLNSPAEKQREDIAANPNTLVNTSRDVPELQGMPEAALSNLSQSEQEKQRQRQRLRELLIRQQIQRNTLRQEKEAAAAALSTSQAGWGGEPGGQSYDQAGRVLMFSATQEKTGLGVIPASSGAAKVMASASFAQKECLNTTLPTPSPAAVDISARHSTEGPQAFYSRGSYSDQQHAWQSQVTAQRTLAPVRFQEGNRLSTSPTVSSGGIVRLPFPGEQVTSSVTVGGAPYIELRHHAQKLPIGVPFSPPGPQNRPRFYLPAESANSPLITGVMRGDGNPLQVPVMRNTLMQPQKVLPSTAPILPQTGNMIGVPQPIQTKVGTAPEIPLQQANVPLAPSTSQSESSKDGSASGLGGGRVQCEDPPELDVDFDTHKDLEDDDLANLSLDVAKADDDLGNLDNLETNDPHLDDLLNGDEFDLLAYTDPELDTGDKKDIFNEHLRLVESANEKAEEEAMLKMEPDIVESRKDSLPNKLQKELQPRADIKIAKDRRPDNLGLDLGPHLSGGGDSSQVPSSVETKQSPFAGDLKPKLEDSDFKVSTCQFSASNSINIKIEASNSTEKVSLGVGLLKTGPSLHTVNTNAIQATNQSGSLFTSKDSSVMNNPSSLMLEKFELDERTLGLPCPRHSPSDDLDKMESSLVASELPLLIEDLLEHEKKEQQKKQLLSVQHPESAQQHPIIATNSPITNQSGPLSQQDNHQANLVGLGIVSRHQGLNSAPQLLTSQQMQQRLVGVQASTTLESSMHVATNQTHLLGGQHLVQAGGPQQQVLPPKPILGQQIIMKPQQQLTNNFFPDTDLEKFAAEDILDPIAKAKMVALKGIKKVMAQGSIAVTPGINRQQVSLLAQRLGVPGPTESTTQGTTVATQERSTIDPTQPRPNPPVFVQGVINEADQRQYEDWLFHTQQLLQMQLKVLEEQIGVHRKSRKALCAKQRTAKKAGREFPEADAEKLKIVTEQQSKIQKQLDQVRKQQKEHTNLMTEYRNKQQQQQQSCGGLPVSPNQNSRVLTKAPGQIVGGHSIQQTSSMPHNQLVGQPGNLRGLQPGLAMQTQHGASYVKSMPQQHQAQGNNTALPGTSSSFYSTTPTLQGLTAEQRMIQEHQLQQQRMQLAQKHQQQHQTFPLSPQNNLSQAVLTKQHGLMGNSHGLVVQQAPAQTPQTIVGHTQASVLQHHTTQQRHILIAQQQQRVLGSSPIAQQQNVIGPRLVLSQSQQNLIGMSHLHQQTVLSQASNTLSQQPLAGQIQAANQNLSVHPQNMHTQQILSIKDSNITDSPLLQEGTETQGHQGVQQSTCSPEIQEPTDQQAQKQVSHNSMGSLNQETDLQPSGTAEGGQPLNSSSDQEQTPYDSASPLQQSVRPQQHSIILSPQQQNLRSLGTQLRPDQLPNTPQHPLSQDNTHITAATSQQPNVIQIQRIVGQSPLQAQGNDHAKDNVGQNLPHPLGQQRPALSGQQTPYAANLMTMQNTPLMAQIRAQLQGIIAKNPQLRHLTPQQQQQLQAILIQRHQQAQNQALRQASHQETAMQPTTAHAVLSNGPPGSQTPSRGIFQVRQTGSVGTEQVQSNYVEEGHSVTIQKVTPEHTVETPQATELDQSSLLKSPGVGRYSVGQTQETAPGQLSQTTNSLRNMAHQPPPQYRMPHSSHQQTPQYQTLQQVQQHQLQQPQQTQQLQLQQPPQVQSIQMQQAQQIQQVPPQSTQMQQHQMQQVQQIQHQLQQPLQTPQPQHQLQQVQQSKQQVQQTQLVQHQMQQVPQQLQQARQQIQQHLQQTQQQVHQNQISQLQQTQQQVQQHQVQAQPLQQTALQQPQIQSLQQAPQQQLQQQLKLAQQQQLTQQLQQTQQQLQLTQQQLQQLQQTQQQLQQTPQQLQQTQQKLQQQLQQLQQTQQQQLQQLQQAQQLQPGQQLQQSQQQLQQLQQAQQLQQLQQTQQQQQLQQLQQTQQQQQQLQQLQQTQQQQQQLQQLQQTQQQQQQLQQLQQTQQQQQQLQQLQQTQQQQQQLQQLQQTQQQLQQLQQTQQQQQQLQQLQQTQQQLQQTQQQQQLQQLQQTQQQQQLQQLQQTQQQQQLQQLQQTQQQQQLQQLQQTQAPQQQHQQLQQTQAPQHQQLQQTQAPQHQQLQQTQAPQQQHQQFQQTQAPQQQLQQLQQTQAPQQQLQQLQQTQAPQQQLQQLQQTQAPQQQLQQQQLLQQLQQTQQQQLQQLQQTQQQQQIQQMPQQLQLMQQTQQQQLQLLQQAQQQQHMQLQQLQQKQQQVQTVQQTQQQQQQLLQTQQQLMQQTQPQLQLTQQQAKHHQMTHLQQNVSQVHHNLQVQQTRVQQSPQMEKTTLQNEMQQEITQSPPLRQPPIQQKTEQEQQEIQHPQQTEKMQHNDQIQESQESETAQQVELSLMQQQHKIEQQQMQQTQHLHLQQGQQQSLLSFQVLPQQITTQQPLQQIQKPQQPQVSQLQPSSQSQTVQQLQQPPQTQQIQQLQTFQNQTPQVLQQFQHQIQHQVQPANLQQHIQQPSQLQTPNKSKAQMQFQQLQNVQIHQQLLNQQTTPQNSQLIQQIGHQQNQMQQLQVKQQTHQKQPAQMQLQLPQSQVPLQPMAQQQSHKAKTQLQQNLVQVQQTQLQQSEVQPQHIQQLKQSQMQQHKQLQHLQPHQIQQVQQILQLKQQMLHQPPQKQLQLQQQLQMHLQQLRQQQTPLHLESLQEPKKEPPELTAICPGAVTTLQPESPNRSPDEHAKTLQPSIDPLMAKTIQSSLVQKLSESQNTELSSAPLSTQGETTIQHNDAPDIKTPELFDSEISTKESKNIASPSEAGGHSCPDETGDPQLNTISQEERMETEHLTRLETVRSPVSPLENGERTQLTKLLKEESVEESVCSNRDIKCEANGDPLTIGAKGEAGHLLLQKLLRAKTVQLASQRSSDSIHTDINGHIDNKLTVLEQKLQAPPRNKDEICAKKTVPKPKRTQKTNEKVPNSRKKIRREDSLKSPGDIVKQLKQELSLLPLVEPSITANFSLFAPFGSSSPVNGKSPLKGSFGNGALESIPDYYTQLLSKNNLSNPPTPPSSLPPTPPPSVQQKMVNGVTAAEDLNEAKKELESTAEVKVERSLDLLAALPTPPHNQSEDVRMESDEESDSPDSIVPASSPESILGEDTPRFPTLCDIKEEQEERALSPVIPLIPRCAIPVFPEVKTAEALPVPPEFADKTILSAAGGTVSWDKTKGSEVSVMLTVSTAAAKNLNGVVAAVAGLLSIKLPSSYEVLFPDSGLKNSVDIRKPVDSSTEGDTSDKDKTQTGKLENSTDWLKQLDAVLPGYTLKSELDILTLLAQEETVVEKAINHCYVNNVSNLDVRQLPVLPEETSPPPSPFAPSPASPIEPPVPEPEPVPPLAPCPLPHPLVSCPLLPPQSSNIEESMDTTIIKQRVRPSEESVEEQRPKIKKWKGVRWKRLHILITFQKMGSRHCEKEVCEVIERLGTTLKPDTLPPDLRKCCFCHEEGDGATDGPARLLNLDLDLWVHLNCALWSTEVYETQGGALINVEVALHRGLLTKCSLCQKTGATNSCNRLRCPNVYHFACAIRAKCMFFKDKTMLCSVHKLKGPCDHELSCFTVFRRVYIERDEVSQIASIIQRGDRIHMFRVGGLVFHAIGQLLPYQLQDFHSVTALYPVGYEATRIYWSMRHSHRRCSYRCRVCDHNGRPEFTVQVIEYGYEDVVLTDSSPQALWNRVAEPVARMRRETGMLRLFPEYLKGEEMFGLTLHAVLRIAESLPGVENCQNYLFRYGRHPLMELPLMINPTGCARSEPKIMTHYKRPHTLNSTSMSKAYQSTFTGETNTPYSKQFVHSKSSQYRRLKTEWKNNVYLARSRIQGLGLYAAKDLEKHTMVIEYIGTIIRNEVANRREKIYEEQNRGIYMFRINNEHVIDATLTGGPARYINHSCAPNCVAEVVTFDKEDKIIIISSRRIPKGEELTYDYQFDFEDDQHKIPCHCGAWNCRKWMN